KASGWPLSGRRCDAVPVGWDGPLVMRLKISIGTSWNRLFLPMARRRIRQRCRDSDESSVHARGGWSLWPGCARPEGKREMVWARARITERIRVRKWGRRRQRQRYDSAVQGEAVTRNH